VHRSHLRALRPHGRVAFWAVTGAVVSGLGLVGLTSFASTPWLFLLYPVLIGLLLTSLGALGLHLIRRF